MTHALAEIRVQLAGHYRLELETVATRRDELKQFGQRLGKKCRQLDAQRAELTAWVDSRQKHLEQEAARLVAREQELQQGEEQLRNLQADWQQERLDLQQQIRALLGR